MIAYPDTSFLCSCYREQEFSARADAFRATMKEPLHFTTLLEFEFIQAIRLQIWLNASDATKGYRESEADQMIADWESDVASGLNILVPFDMNAVLRLKLRGAFFRTRSLDSFQRRREPFHRKRPTGGRMSLPFIALATKG